MEKAVSSFVRVSRRIRDALGVLSSIGVLLMVLSIVPDVVGRYFFKHPISGVLELNELLMISVVFLPLAMNQAKRVNVRVTVLLSVLPPAWSFGANLFSFILGFLFFVSMAKGTIERAFESFIQGEFSGGVVQFPLWPSKVVMAIGVCLLCVQIASDIIGEIRKKAHSKRTLA